MEELKAELDAAILSRNKAWQENDALTSVNSKMEMSLKRIIGMCEVGPTCSCGKPNGLPAVISCAQKGLSHLNKAES